MIKIRFSTIFVRIDQEQIIRVRYNGTGAGCNSIYTVLDIQEYDNKKLNNGIKSFSS